MRFVNGYGFAKHLAPPPPTPEVLEKGAARIWEEDFAPRIAAFCRELRSRDFDAMTAAALADELPALLDAAGDTFRYTMIVVLPFMGPGIALTEFSEQALGPDGPMLVASLLQGYENETANAGTGLGKLASQARSAPDIARALREGRTEALASLPGGAAFLAELRAYLDEYGWRVDDWSLVHVPTWAEDVERPLRVLATYLEAGDADPAAGLARSAASRAAAERAVEARLSAEHRAQFEAMLAAAREHVPVSEGRARWQLTITGRTRVPVLALGRKLVASGVLAEANDAFYLDLDELQQAARAPGVSLQDRVRERKAELARWEQLDPPPFIGAPPDMSAAPPEVQAVFRRFFGMGVQPSANPSVVTGNAASRGIARGRARVARTLADADSLQPGEVLVCTMTAPPWTPLFAVAAAVVTDTGGVLSHSAICAREYGIPCVAGTMVGTRAIPDGAMVEVDGDAGTVRILG